MTKDGANVVDALVGSLVGFPRREHTSDAMIRSHEPARELGSRQDTALSDARRISSSIAPSSNASPPTISAEVAMSPAVVMGLAFTSACHMGRSH